MIGGRSLKKASFFSSADEASESRIGVGESVATHFLKSARQDALQDAMDEAHGGERAWQVLVREFKPPSPHVLIAKATILSRCNPPRATYHWATLSRAVKHNSLPVAWNNH